MKSSRLLMLMAVVAVNVPVVAMAQGTPKAAKPTKPAKPSKAVARGEYLVRITGCNDCHTPFAMGPQGPAPDMSRMLSGHPETMKLPPPPAAQGPWIAASSATNTAWAGPWGVSYAINLTPDETGMGTWTEKMFIDAMRTGKHMGRGRPILPPMPWGNVAAMTDEDLKSVYAYLKSIPAIKNATPEPTPPAGGVPPGGAVGPTGPSGPPAGKAATGGQQQAPGQNK